MRRLSAWFAGRSSKKFKSRTPDKRIQPKSGTIFMFRPCRGTPIGPGMAITEADKEGLTIRIDPEELPPEMRERLWEK